MEVPVIVGVGHETDQTLIDVVAHTACKTPTAVADFIVDRMAEFEGAVGREGRAIAARIPGSAFGEPEVVGAVSTMVKERPTCPGSGGARSAVSQERMPSSAEPEPCCPAARLGGPIQITHVFCGLDYAGRPIRSSWRSARAHALGSGPPAEATGGACREHQGHADPLGP